MLQVEQGARACPGCELAPFCGHGAGGVKELLFDPAGIAHLHLNAVVEPVEQTGHADQIVRLNDLEIFSQGGDISHKTDGSAKLDPVVDLGAEGIGVRPGQHRESDAFFIELGVDLVACLRAVGQVPVGQQDSLRFGNRAGGVDKHRDIIEMGHLRRYGVLPAYLLERGQAVLPLGIHHKDPLKGGNFLRKTLHLLVDPPVRNQQKFDGAVLDHVTPGLRQLLFVHGDIAGLASVCGKGKNRPFRPVARDHPDGITLPDTHLSQTAAHSIDPPADLAIGRGIEGAFVIMRPEQNVVPESFFAFDPPLDKVVRLFICPHL